MPSDRNTMGQVALRLGVTTLGVGTLVGVYYYWSNLKKKRQEELRKKFLLDPVDSVETELLEHMRKEALEELDGGRKENGTSKTDKNATRNENSQTQLRFVTIDVVIPKEHARGFIGKFGSNIQKIQQDTNTKISSQRETLDNGDRVYKIQGTPGDVRLAELEIKKYIMSQPIQRTIEIQVPSSAIGRIIGRQGENIRAMQDQSKAKISTGSREDGFGDGPSRDMQMTSILIRGTDDQIEMAKACIQEKVDAEEYLRKKITTSTIGRSKRRAGTLPVRSDESVLAEQFHLRHDGTMEVYVSCIYNPNYFMIQVIGMSSIELDKLCETMTEFYSRLPDLNENEVKSIEKGELVAAPFDLDGRIYRGRVLELNGDKAQILYVDYGDKREVELIKLYLIRPEHLKLRFQAIEATLNLDYQEEWPMEIINDFCNLTDCAGWTQILSAKVKDYLKDEENQDIVWVELFNSNQMNIGKEILRRLKNGEQLNSSVDSANSPSESELVSVEDSPDESSSAASESKIETNVTSVNAAETWENGNTGAGHGVP